jgi:NAD(P)-dependent dehydrogenase (short-subunit alcohol dehydrogenase family)
MKVEGKVWVVTGGGSGMGRELVLELLRRGARVAAVDVRADTLQQTVDLAAAGDRLSAHCADITDRDATSNLVEDVVAVHGGVDGLINNAGIIQPFVPVVQMQDRDIDRVLDVNLVGTIRMVRAFLPALLERPEAHLVNVSSMGGFFPFPGQTMYGASKAAVKLLTEGLYAELLDTQVSVSVVMPGAVATNITENSGVVMPGGAAAAESSAAARSTPADAAARIILDGVERDRLHIYVGRDAQLMSLAIRIAPRRAIELVQKQMKKLIEPAQPSVPVP